MHRPFSSFAFGTDIHDPAQQMIWNSLVMPREEQVKFGGPTGVFAQAPWPQEKIEHITLDSIFFPDEEQEDRKLRYVEWMQDEHDGGVNYVMDESQNSYSKYSGDNIYKYFDVYVDNMRKWIAWGVNVTKSYEYDIKNYLYPKLNDRSKLALWDGWKPVGLDFIKMDVEGMENHILLGGLKTLERYKPYILVEIKKFHRTQVLRFLIDWGGYKCHSVLSTNPSDFFCWHPHRVQ